MNLWYNLENNFNRQLFIAYQYHSHPHCYVFSRCAACLNYRVWIFFLSAFLWFLETPPDSFKTAPCSQLCIVGVNTLRSRHWSLRTSLGVVVIVTRYSSDNCTLKWFESKQDSCKRSNGPTWGRIRKGFRHHYRVTYSQNCIFERISGFSVVAVQQWVTGERPAGDAHNYWMRVATRRVSCELDSWFFCMQPKNRIRCDSVWDKFFGQSAPDSRILRFLLVLTQSVCAPLTVISMTFLSIDLESAS